MNLSSFHRPGMGSRENAIQNARPTSKPVFSHLSGMVLLAVLLLGTGCVPRNVPLPGSETGAGEALFSDNFDNPPSGWGTWNRGGASVEYHGGGLRILVSETQFDFWSVAGQKFSDASITVDAIKMSGPDDNDFGIVCRYLNKDNFYMLVASSDGYYGIAKMKDGQHSMIHAEQLQYSDVIASGQAVNHLRADCIGSNLTLYVNGQKLTEAQDDEFASGDVGVIAGAYDTQGVDILFDNFVVMQP
jgi:hypothetical protein